MPKGIDVVHLEAAHLQAFQPIPRSQGPGGGALHTGLAKHALRQEIAAHRGVRRQRGVTVFESGAQVVKVQLHRPAGMLAVLLGQGVNDGLRQTGEVGNTPTQAVLQGGHRVGCLARRVVPALQAGQAKRGVESSAWVAPGFCRKCAQCAVQFTSGRRGSQQGANDDEAQARPSIALVRVFYGVQITLQMLPYRRYGLLA